MVGGCECMVVWWSVWWWGVVYAGVYGGAGGGEVVAWWGNHCYKAERRARDTTYTLQPRDEGGHGGVLDFEPF